MLKHIVFTVLFIFVTLNAFAHNNVYWQDPVFINLTFMNIYYIKIETKAQGKDHSIIYGKNKQSFENNKHIKPMEIFTFKGRLGGEFFNNSLEGKNYTKWKVTMVTETIREDIYTLTRNVKYSNEIGNGPALSFWPPSRRLNTSKSYLSLFYDEDDDMYKLHVQLINTKGEIEISYNIKLLLKYKKDDSFVSSL